MKKIFRAKICVPVPLAATNRPYTKQRARHGSPFQEPPPPPSPGAHAIPPHPPTKQFSGRPGAERQRGGAWPGRRFAWGRREGGTGDKRFKVRRTCGFEGAVCLEGKDPLPPRRREGRLHPDRFWPASMALPNRFETASTSPPPTATTFPATAFATAPEP